MQVLAINDVILTVIPGEIFVEIESKIKRKSSFTAHLALLLLELTATLASVAFTRVEHEKVHLETLLERKTASRSDPALSAVIL